MILLLSLLTYFLASSSAFFKDISEQLSKCQTKQLSSGIAVTDIDFDGRFEWIVAGFHAPNLVLKYNPNNDSYTILQSEPFANIMDPDGAALGVAACDIDGDGREEIYFVNANLAYGGKSFYRHSLFKWRNGRYEDLFRDPLNQAISLSGRSVACLDRHGTGIYSFVVASYAMKGYGEFVLIEMDIGHPENDPKKWTNCAEKRGKRGAVGQN